MLFEWTLFGLPLFSFSVRRHSELEDLIELVGDEEEEDDPDVIPSAAGRLDIAPRFGFSSPSMDEEEEDEE